MDFTTTVSYKGSGQYELMLYFEDRSIELILPQEPIDRHNIIVQVKGNAVKVGCIVPDEDTENPCTDGSGMGLILSSHRNRSSDHAAFRAAHGLDQNWSRKKSLKPNPDRVIIDVYEHSGTVYSVHGEGFDCRWDTAKGGAVWVPDTEMKKELNGLRRAKREQLCLERARLACRLYTSWVNGWGCTWIVANYTLPEIGSETDPIEPDDIDYGYSCYFKSDAKEGLREALGEDN